MATKDYTTQGSQTTVASTLTWANLTGGDDGTAAQRAQYTDKSVQVFGNFGTDGALEFKGSNNGVNWHTLTDPLGNPIRLTAENIKLVSEATLWVKPFVTGTDPTIDLTVVLLLKE